ncbi:MAG: translation initiation factor IF-2 [Candidatus Pacebacteria bacterium]|nr:translation initiation factor IF-2 [Candidatus Paceibacterota bacterium]
MSDKKTNNIIERSPVIVVMGHIDHGKSTLLDFIRHSNVVEKEAGSITQHMSAYEVVHKNREGLDKKITFIDTPGHAAFSAMRARGACVADIAVLIISAEDGVKPQTLEAFQSIQEAKIPFIVAINKIDKPGANVEKVKQELMENKIFLEGSGGDIPFAAISAKTGEGVPELLDTMLLVAEMEELKGETRKPATGIILESKRDAQTGVETVAIIKNGTLREGDFLVVKNKVSVARRLEDFLGNQIETASFSSPVKIIGCREMPEAGLPLDAFPTKKEAEQNLEKKDKTAFFADSGRASADGEDDKIKIFIIIKADVFGTIDAIQQEIAKIKNERAIIDIISTGVGDISENDVKLAGRGERTLVVGFNVGTSRQVEDLANRRNIKIASFDVIYKLTEWLEENIKILIPKIKTEEKTGRAKIIKIFSKTKTNQIIGGKVQEGKLALSSEVKILRRDYEIGRGIIANLQKQKTQVKELEEGDEFGMDLKSKTDIAPGDILEAFVIIER